MANIRFLAVAEGYRRRGIATGLIRFLCRYCYDSVTPVLCTFSAPDKTDPVYLLFAEMEDFSVAEAEGYVCQIPLSCLAGDPTLASLAERGRQPRRLFDLSAAARRSLLLDLKRRGPFYLQAGDEEALVKPLCLYTRDSEHVTAALFFSRDGTDLELSFAWSAPGGQRDLMGLLGRVAVQFSAGSRGMLRIAAVSPASAAIVDKLLPGREITARFYQPRGTWSFWRRLPHRERRTTMPLPNDELLQQAHLQQQPLLQVQQQQQQQPLLQASSNSSNSNSSRPSPRSYRPCRCRPTSPSPPPRSAPASAARTPKSRRSSGRPPRRRPTSSPAATRWSVSAGPPGPPTTWPTTGRPSAPSAPFWRSSSRPSTCGKRPT